MKTPMTLILLFAFICGSEAQEKPNILFIAIDDLRPELGCYGAAQVKTPHLDKLAGQGPNFDEKRWWKSR